MIRVNHRATRVAGWLGTEYGVVESKHVMTQMDSSSPKFELGDNDLNVIEALSDGSLRCAKQAKYVNHL